MEKERERDFSSRNAGAHKTADLRTKILGFYYYYYYYYYCYS